MIKVGVYGATGYMGGEALRVLYEHPEVEIAWASSRNDEPLSATHRNFYQADIPLRSSDEPIDDCDVLFYAGPADVLMKQAEKILSKGIKIIDLGSTFRLKDKETWERVYGESHSAWSVAEEAVYGIPELYRDEIKKARVIANPGCFSSAAILGLAPLLKAGLIDETKIVIDGLSGTAGAGAGLDRTMHHPEVTNNIVPYNVVDHRHTYEMEQELSTIGGGEAQVHFTPAYVPISRGILDVCHVFPNKPITREEILSIYRKVYSDQYFVKVFDQPFDADASWQYKPYPWVAQVSGTNFCHIGFDVDEQRNRIVVFSVLDSIGKGGAHVAVQNMNLMFGLPERTGLERLGLHPY